MQSLQLAFDWGAETLAEGGLHQRISGMDDCHLLIGVVCGQLPRNLNTNSAPSYDHDSVRCFNLQIKNNKNNKVNLYSAVTMQIYSTALLKRIVNYITGEFVQKWQDTHINVRVNSNLAIKLLRQRLEKYCWMSKPWMNV